MALIKCHECGTEVSTEAEKCPKCGAIPKTAINKIQAFLALGIVVFLGYFFFGGGLEKQADKEIAKVEQTVADDMIKQYNISKTNGNKIEQCIHAGLVVAAWLQAKDVVNHKAWLDIQAADCKAAGMPTDIN